jgi:citrate lyase subunit beta/citryl-CoA lyase
MDKKGIAGNAGPGVKSDCRVVFTPRNSGGRVIDLKSRVEAYYGNSIRKLADNMLDLFGVEHGELQIEDSGALEFVLAARIEAAVKAVLETDKEFLP